MISKVFIIPRYFIFLFVGGGREIEKGDGVNEGESKINDTYI